MRIRQELNAPVEAQQSNFTSHLGRMLEDSGLLSALVAVSPCRGGVLEEGVERVQQEHVCKSSTRVKTVFRVWVRKVYLRAAISPVKISCSCSVPHPLFLGSPLPVI
jgi:hypothetical protein